MSDDVYAIFGGVNHEILRFSCSGSIDMKPRDLLQGGQYVVVVARP